MLLSFSISYDLRAGLTQAKRRSSIRQLTGLLNQKTNIGSREVTSNCDLDVKRLRIDIDISIYLWYYIDTSREEVKTDTEKVR